MDAFLALFGQVERAEIPHPVVQFACVRASTAVRAFFHAAIDIVSVFTPSGCFIVCPLT